ncbi:2C-methyl-D-erythritol 2,4-cyclodiphosphate synthase domain protein [Ehrlichia japonica]|uniref:2C-methyl-D-erythritol 2,4-cyclodiphosphate synthase domain protein n=1 Tax=Ehrlichia japonica TaxID=391036 RepID=X5GKS1_9RICK|nr:2C-methyl-D-erythritol 2,4-cyclodiphosphate synthase domain protein [Ehrlichia japonica]
MNQHINKPMFKVGIGYDVHKFDNTPHHNINTFITICSIKINFIIVKI